MHLWSIPIRRSDTFMPNTKKSETGIQPNENELQLQSSTAAENGEAIPPAPAQKTEKPKRTSRKKKVEAEPANDAENTAAEKAAEVADSSLAQVVANHINQIIPHFYKADLSLPLMLTPMYKLRKMLTIQFGTIFKMHTSPKEF